MPLAGHRLRGRLSQIRVPAAGCLREKFRAAADREVSTGKASARREGDKRGTDKEGPAQ
jgi:hypothetical protein